MSERPPDASANGGKPKGAKPKAANATKAKSTGRTNGVSAAVAEEDDGDGDGDGESRDGLRGPSKSQSKKAQKTRLLPNCQPSALAMDE